MKMQNNKIFIIGGGFIGTALKRACKREPLEAELITRDKIDYHSRAKILSLFAEKFGIDNNIVINCSGFTGRPNIDQCENEKEKTWKFNALLPKVLEEATHTAGGILCHVSSGCIYTGYDEAYTEDHKPNFGLYNTESSFYSKSKHAAELTLNTKLSYVWRVRMPFTYNDPSHARNYLTKLRGYDNIIDNINSRTCVEDFCHLLVKFFKYPDSLPEGIYNVVNPEPLTVSEIISVLPEKYKNPNWNIIPLEKMQTKAGRSNCMLSDSKLSEYNYQLPKEIDSWKKFL
jgi:UDP-glucose 4,6-dehydratase